MEMGKKKSGRSNIEKGNVNVKRAARIVEAWGFATHICVNTSRMIKPPSPKYPRGIWISQSQDIFGCDIIGKKEGERDLWLQVTYAAEVSNRIKEIMKHPWSPQHDNVQVWGWNAKGKYYTVYKHDDDWSTPSIYDRIYLNEHRESGLPSV